MTDRYSHPPKPNLGTRNQRKASMGLDGKVVSPRFKSANQSASYFPTFTWLGDREYSQQVRHVKKDY